MTMLPSLTPDLSDFGGISNILTTADGYGVPTHPAISNRGRFSPGDFSPTVFRPPFSDFQTQTDDSLPSVALVYSGRVPFDSPEEMRAMIRLWDWAARNAAWVGNPLDGYFRLIVGRGHCTDDGMGQSAQIGNIKITLTAYDIRLYGPDGQVLLG